jgi:aminopeptidase-like protein
MRCHYTNDFGFYWHVIDLSNYIYLNLWKTGLLNDERIIKTLKKVKYDFVMHMKIFATTNDMNLPNPIKSRFMTYKIPAYTDEEFVKVSQFCVADKFNKEISGMIASVLMAHKMKDIRQVINVSRLIKPKYTEDEIVRKIETMFKYK